MFNHDYFLYELFKQRQQELWEEARLKRLLREHKRSRCGSRQRLTGKIGGLLIIVENRFEDGEWAILEWRDPLGLRGCGFFHVVDGQIQCQRGCWDKLSFLRPHGLPLPTE